MIMTAVQGGYTLEEMHVPTFYLDVRTCYYRVVMYMVVAFCGITGYIVYMAVKIRIFGGYSGKIVKMSGSLAASASIAVCVQFIIHVINPLLLIYAAAALLDINAVNYSRIIEQQERVLLLLFYLYRGSDL